MKLEVTQEGDIHIFKFTKDGIEVKKVSYKDETYQLIANHFKPKEVKVEWKSNPDFDRLWKIHAKGNKATAKQRFVKAIKNISIEDLETKLQLYVKSNDFCYLKGLDVWLNPLKEHWDDPIVKKEDKFKKEEPAKPSFFR